MAFIVIYDACVLYPAPLRDLLVRVGMTGLVQVKWTDDILEECFRSILEKKPELTADRLKRTRTLMNRAIRDVLVEGYGDLVDILDLPDPDDRHVLAAAVRCGAQAIITTNLKHFPHEALSPYSMEALHPDDFILDLLDLAPGVILKVLDEQMQALKSPPVALSDLLDTLESNGLVQSMSEVRQLMAMEGPTTL